VFAEAAPVLDGLRSEVIWDQGCVYLADRLRLGTQVVDRYLREALDRSFARGRGAREEPDEVPPPPEAWPEDAAAVYAPAPLPDEDEAPPSPVRPITALDRDALAFLLALPERLPAFLQDDGGARLLHPDLVRILLRLVPEVEEALAEDPAMRLPVSRYLADLPESASRNACFEALSRAELIPADEADRHYATLLRSLESAALVSAQAGGLEALQTAWDPDEKSRKLAEIWAARARRAGLRAHANTATLRGPERVARELRSDG
jgi:hypothetical protein